MHMKMRRRAKPSHLTLAVILVAVFFMCGLILVETDTSYIVVEFVEMIIDAINDLLYNVPQTMLSILLFPVSVARYAYSFNSPIDDIHVAGILHSPDSTSYFRVGSVPKCKLQGHPLKCTWHIIPSEHHAVIHGFHAVLHEPSDSCSIAHRNPDHDYLRGLWAPPSRFRSVCLDMPDYIRQFDIEVSYRHCAEIHLNSFFLHDVTSKDISRPPLDVKVKKNAIVFMETSCPRHDRSKNILESIQQVLTRHESPLELHVYGNCSHNSLATTRDRVSLFKNYKFCLVIETADDNDYISNTIWDAFIAGCVPVYIGAPNMNNFLPDITSTIIVESHIFEPLILVQELETLAANEKLYEKKLRWKQHHTSASTLMKKHASVFPYSSDTRCRLCQLVALRRLHNKNATYRRCDGVTKIK